MSTIVSRRCVLRGGGALVFAFAVAPALAQQGEVQGAAPTAAKPELPGSLADTPRLDAWIRIDPDGSIHVFTGRAELGQGTKTAMRQVAAEELGVEPAAIDLVTADTALTPDEGYTAGSMAMPEGATAIRNAAAQVRELLVAAAAPRLGADPAALRADGGAVIAADGRRIPFGELVTAELLHAEASPTSKLTPPDRLRQIGVSVPRVDIPGKVTGAPAYVQDLRLPGMLHARLVRPPSYEARLVAVDTAPVEALPGVVAVVRDGRFLAVVAEREFQAIKAMRHLARAAQWEESPRLPEGSLPDALKAMAKADGLVVRTGAGAAIGAGTTISARYTRPFQAHGSIGPSCAVAHWQDDLMTVWTHTQGVYPDRRAIAEMLRLPETQVRCIHTEGAGCYGHNGADDAAADAAIIARAVPGRPIRLQWTREQEHAWEPYGPGMVTEVSATLGPDGTVTTWRYDLWSNTHSTRPGKAGSLLPARLLAAPFAPAPAKMQINLSGNGDRNSVPYYAIPDMEVHWHFLPDMPLRVSALRALGAYANVFAIESTMDDLARIAGRDPVAFRLAHLADPRARDVVQAAADGFGWTDWQPSPGRGRGFAFGRYKNYAAYLALAVEVSVDLDSGRTRVVRANAAIDAGTAVNPDGIVNQTEGGILQATSWTLYEAVRFDATRIRSIDWASYPILRFQAVPDSVDVAVINRPGEPFLGAGEAAQGPTPAAIANAIRDAAGIRLRDLPFTRERVLDALRGAAARDA